MMKKIILLGLCIVFLLGVVSAWEEGQEFTQQQLDNFDVDTITWQVLECSKDGYHIADWSVYLDYSCWNLDPTEEGTYVVWRSEFSMGLKIKKALQCVAEYGVSSCREGYRELARTEAMRTVDIIRGQIRDYQTPDDEGIAGWFEGWELFG